MEPKIIIGNLSEGKSIDFRKVLDEGCAVIILNGITDFLEWEGLEWIEIQF